MRLFLVFLCSCAPAAISDPIEAPPDATPPAADATTFDDAEVKALPDAAVEDAQPDAAPDAATEEDAAPPDAGLPDAGEEEEEIGTVQGCVAQSAHDFTCTLAHDGLDREYLLHVPEAYLTHPPEGAPLLFNFHGLASSSEQQLEISLMIDKSDSEGFILIHPRGTGTIKSFNAGFCCGTAASQNVDDTGFTLAMIERVAATLSVDRSRIFATGLSNGGHMAYRLACEHADVFAAIAVVAGVVAQVPCLPSRPVPVLHFHGTADAIVGYNSGSSTGGLSAPETVAGWADRNGCSETTVTTYQQGEVICEAHEGCPDGAHAELCTIQGGGHTWPGGDNPFWLGYATEDISATDYLWTFFTTR